ncbi:MAG: cytochrome o ubiquinol oxidase subunit IV [Candidimonas sp.]|nr:MAG: cytochrome o ubiquinol oxidase subunit IV [Candidimonas sp.]TAM19130.1 MAG: cytochrome o ubiquinol oxidase subunit IV [Candidimonas sp.]TAM76548.1 MAG: cytochrome o ubiquinol oxidase subunit IV [Candidimonas sp.]
MSHPSPSGAVASPGHDDGAMQAHEGSLRSYLTGFVLAAILTIIPFWLVMGHVIENRFATIVIVLILAVVQIFVHIIYFLHLDTRSEGGWNLLAFIFAAVLVVIVLGASTWALYNENVNMMPGMMPGTSQQQHSTHGS